MKIYNIDGELVSVDIRQSSYPIKGKSESILQGKVGQKLVEKFGNSVLEEFPVAGSRMHVDYFVANKGIVVEVGSGLHEKFVPFFHGSKSSDNFPKQIKRDMKKVEWADLNNFRFIEISTEEELNKLDNL